MIIIQSNSDDTSTNDVMDWLFNLGCEKCFRLNDEINIEAISFENKISIKIDDVIFYFHNIRSFWYRRGVLKPKTTNRLLIDNYAYHLSLPVSSEVNSIFSLLDIFKTDNSIGKFSDNLIDKVRTLSCANQCGLKIPKTVVTGKKQLLLDFFNLNENVITKSFGINSLSFFYNAIYKCMFSLGTEIVKYTDIATDMLSESLPSLFQQYIPKKFELRIFYLKSKFYSMAIFSQENEKTKIDFRNYDHERPNRCVPYKLPEDIEQKLDKFMKAVDLNCGSIDMIYTPEGEYVFLEVNPVGQFQWLSKNCNYDIERQIAKTLLQHD